MHAATLQALRAAILAELQSDPTARGYAGKSPGQIAALMNLPVVVTAAPVRQDVLISDVKGYLARRLVIVRLRRAVPTLTGDAKDVAEALLDIMADTQLTRFLTADDAKRAGVLGMFALLVQAGAGGLTQAMYDDIEAMTLAPAGEAETQPARWLAVIDGIGGEGNEPGPPNAASEALIAEALADGNG